MSQKSTRRARRQTNDDDPPSFKAPTPKPNGSESAEELLPVAQEEAEETAPAQDDPKIEQNGTEKDIKETDSCIVTRSRSTTPQVKKVPVNGHEENEKEEEEEKAEKEDDKEGDDLNVSNRDTETEMDPLILSDEPDPELVFEENSDLESGRSSPILTRCKTRRSITRSIPTPKTPKSVEENENVTPSPPIEVDVTNKDCDQELNVTFESCADDISTKAEAGSDSTRLDYMNKDFSNLETNSFLQEAKNKSFGETLRHLSTRRTIRPINDDYRRRFLQTNFDKTDYSATYPTRNSVERISSVGIKRKNCSEGDEECSKRFKSEAPGFFSKFTSPLTSIRNTFRSDIPSSTPKLTGYKDEKFMLEDDDISSKMCEVQDGERRWCSIM
ncbi:hypothetical protein BDFB_006674 [Asbolus verrucosus]|uniref:Uncharacterized protein n=1 Tax=Asbolus verrucosus TaxID=1661398 RepID=A0A482VNN4_ASBVE|nr:hypothetical protein BDFB_006674 [Asbolus verrucosus]